LTGAEPLPAAAGNPDGAVDARGPGLLSAGQMGTDLLGTFQQEAFLSATRTSRDMF